MSLHQKSKLRKTYVKPVISVQGNIADLTQSKTWGSGDSLIVSINIPAPIANIIDSITHYS